MTDWKKITSDMLDLSFPSQKYTLDEVILQTLPYLDPVSAATSSLVTLFQKDHFLIPEKEKIVSLLSVVMDYHYPLLVEILATLEDKKAEYQILFTRYYRDFKFTRVSGGRKGFKHLVYHGWFLLNIESEKPCHTPLGGCCFLLPEKEAIKVLRSSAIDKKTKMREKILQCLSKCYRTDVILELISQDRIIYRTLDEYYEDSFNLLVRMIERDAMPIVQALMERPIAKVMTRHIRMTGDTTFLMTLPKYPIYTRLMMKYSVTDVHGVNKKNGNNALHLACQLPEVDQDIAISLISQKVNPSLKNQEGLTPLWYACKSKMKRVAEMILETANPGDLTISFSKGGKNNLATFAIYHQWEFLLQYLAKYQPELLRDSYSPSDPTMPLVFLAANIHLPQMVKIIVNTHPTLTDVIYQDKCLAHYCQKYGWWELYDEIKNLMSIPIPEIKEENIKKENIFGESDDSDSDEFYFI